MMSHVISYDTRRKSSPVGGPGLRTVFFWFVYRLFLPLLRPSGSLLLAGWPEREHVPTYVLFKYLHLKNLLSHLRKH